MGKSQEQALHRRGHPSDQKQKKRFSTSLFTREMWITVTTRYFCIPTRKAKMKTKTKIKELANTWNNWSSRILQMVMYTGTSSLEICLAVSTEVKHTSTLQPNKPIPRYASNRNRVYVHGCFIHNNQDW